MSEIIKHECGIALVRLKKPVEYYVSHYGTSLYALNKLYLLMEKQHNRGQDGAGLACIKLDTKPGEPYINRIRSVAESPIKAIFDEIFNGIRVAVSENKERLKDAVWLKDKAKFLGELYLGHLRYGTYGKNIIENCHPLLRENNWKTRNLALAGNFNLTNVNELFNDLLRIGQHPKDSSDTITVIEKIGHFLDEENERLFRQFKSEGYSKQEISPLIGRDLDVLDIIKRSAKYWDGGYVIGGLIGHGDAFVMRDPSGIRPAYFFENEDIIIVASERPPIQTALNISAEDVKEIEPGHALIIKKDGSIQHDAFLKANVKRSCSFERIYFSRGTDKEIYQERKNLGKRLAPAILQKINFDFANTVFSYIPNTAAVAFWGMIEALNTYCDKIKKEKLQNLTDLSNDEEVSKILQLHPRSELVAVKDIKLRTFITQDSSRDDMVAHVYDITYGSIRNGKDTLVILDDSIVRGTTLKQSIIRILDRLGPREIIIVSSAPQIRYPDCYGIDMAKLSDLIAFKAAIKLLHEHNLSGLLSEVYQLAKNQDNKPEYEVENYVRRIYKEFTSEQISEKIAQLVTPKGVRAEVRIIFQSIEDLHASCPNHKGDWYFDGNYPTSGGTKTVNRSFVNYIEGKDKRGYVV